MFTRANPWLSSVLETSRQLEAVNVSVPVKVTVSRLELRRKDKRAAINRVDADRAVITPARQSCCLNSAAHEDRSLVAERSERIGRATICITNARHYRAAVRDVVADRDTAGLVHRRAAHPTKIIGWRERALLPEHWRRRRERLPGSIRQLIPANTHAAATRHRMVDHERLTRTEIAITQAIHESISERIKLVGSSRLRNAGAAATSPTESRDS